MSRNSGDGVSRRDVLKWLGTGGASVASQTRARDLTPETAKQTETQQHLANVRTDKGLLGRY